MHCWAGAAATIPQVMEPYRIQLSGGERQRRQPALRSAHLVVEASLKQALVGPEAGVCWGQLCRHVIADVIEGDGHGAHVVPVGGGRGR
jgi:hypothetical protein